VISNRRGIALVGALALMTMLGLLVVGAVAATSIAQRVESLAASGPQYAAAADYAVASALDQPPASLADLPFGQTAVWATGDATVAATRLAGGMIWLVAEARSARDDGAGRRANLVARFATAGLPPMAALTARGSIQAGADVIVTADSAGEPDCFSLPAGPAIQTSDSATLFDRAWQRALLDSAPTVRHARGDTVVAGGVFSGVLLVDGTLTFDGVVDLTGLVIAGGRIQTARPGLSLVGAMVSRAPGAAAIDLGGASIRYSPCAAALALRRAAALRPVRGRAWAEVF
jgi:hypothetical protein